MLNIKQALCFVLLLGTLAQAAPSPHNVSMFGHNFTPTSYTLKEKEWTVGSYAAGYGLTENLSLLTSPWFIGFYNMPNLVLKYGTKIGDTWQWSTDVGYFKTFSYLANYYKQESPMLRLTFTKNFNAIYSLHMNALGFYFVDDTRPFSFRLSPRMKTDYMIGVGSLLEMHLSDSFGAMLEFGFLGINYLNSYMHTGMSVFWKWQEGYLLAGMSQDLTIYPVEYRSADSFVERRLEYMPHPEIQLQLYF